VHENIRCFTVIKANCFLHNVQERREREQQELESAKEIADDDFDDFP